MESIALNYMRAILALFFVFIQIEGCFCQTKDEYDLLKTLRNSPESVKDSIYYELFKLTRIDNQKSALEYSLTGLELAELNGHFYLQAKFLNAVGWLYSSKSDWAKSEQYYQQGLDLAIANNYTDRVMFFYNNLGVLYEEQSRFDAALDNYLKSIEIARKLDSKRDQIITLNNIGLVFYRLSEYEKAIDNLSESIKLAIESDIKSELSYSYLNQGLCLNELKQFQSAKASFQKALELCDTESCEDKVLADINLGYGVSELSLGHVTESSNYFKNSIRIAEKINYSIALSLNYFYLAKVSFNQKDYKQALDKLEQSQQIASNINSQFRKSNNYELFSEIYEKIGQYPMALAYKNKYIQSKDSIFNTKLNENLNKILVTEAQKESQAIIRVKEGELKAKEEIIRLQTYVNVALIIIFILGLLLFLVMMKTTRAIKRVNAKLSEANETIEIQNKLLENQNKNLDEEVIHKTADLEKAFSMLKQVNEELDNFIYKTSHDIKGPLATLRGMCYVALKDVQDDSIAIPYLERIKETAEKLNSILIRLITVNRISNTKLSISQVQLEPLINNILKQEKKIHTNVPIDFYVSIEPKNNFHTDAELLEKILENLIDNAIKFRKKEDGVNSFVKITAKEVKHDSIQIQIIDNGIGIREKNTQELFKIFARDSELSETGGIGLYLVKTATQKLGGKSGIGTSKEGYTVFFIEIPNLV